MGREKSLGCPARKENLKKKSRKSSRRGIGREKSLECPASTDIDFPYRRSVKC